MSELHPPGPPDAARCDEAIAVIGIGCRYPGGGDLDAFWRLLREGRDAISEVPRERWDASAYYDPNLATPGTMNTRWGGFLPDLEQFDAGFFGVTAGEATAMDPQHRLLLEVSWEALEDAGQSPARLAGSRTGVFVGMIGDDSDRVACTRGEPPNAYYAAGHVHCLAPNRISRFLDLRGPSLVVDSGCSASLYAIHLACQSLRSGESTLAIAGGVNVILAASQTVAASQAWMTSASGRCKSFDVDADGYVRSEGCGLVVLKPLDQALANGDRIWGVIRKSGVNQDGRTKSVTSPSARAIAELVRGVLRDAGVTPAEIDYVEAHGVGTPATDAAEAEALRDVLGAPPGRERPCLVGSLKPNIGHPEPAAGVASLIKVLLSLTHETIAPHIHLERLRPELDLPGIVEIPSTPRPWPRTPGRRRRAGVNSFGIGGANAHLLVEEAPVPPCEEAPARPAHLFTLSARSAGALRALAARHAEHLAAHPGEALADVCFTANTGRTHFAHRLAIVCASTADLRAQIDAYVAGGTAPAMHPGAAALERARAVARDGASAWPPSLASGEHRSLLEGVAALYLEQVPIDWDGVEAPGRRRVGLPTYPFQRRRYWPRKADGDEARAAAPSETAAPSVAAAAPREDTPWVTALRAAPASERRRAALEMVQGEVARLVGAPEVEPRVPLTDLGLTSLTAVELRDALAARTGVPLSATLAFDHPHPEAIADFLLAQILPRASDAARQPSPRATTADEPIAIVGIGCRFPGGVTDPGSFWRLLQDGGDAIVEVPRNRWDLAEWYDPSPDAPGKMTTRWGGFLEDIDRFEPGFFDISPREAPAIDPQERLLLEVSYAALEHAGFPLDRLSGSDTGVFMGVCGNDYQFRTLADARAIDAYTVLGTAHSTIVGRLSYWLGLEGPNLAIDTACSSSLLAVHLACQALRAGECSLALAGGVSVILSPHMTVYFSKMGGVSPTGRCRAFSHDADGFVRSEGCGVVVLKRLSDAQRDGDSILAVVRGTAVNQDGRSNGLMAPSGPSQEAVIRRALEQAKVAPDAVSYVECHGTGTSLGDPIEINALAAALGAGRPPDRPALVGSVKSNLGHTEGAAGIAGLIKVVLCLEHEKIAKTIHFTKPNPLIPWDALPLKVAAETQDWKRGATPRIAGVSAFGFSGTNVHAVIEEALVERDPAREAPAADDAAGADLLVLSAKSDGSLRALAAAYAAHLERHPEQPLPDLCRRAATARTHFDRRAAVVASGREEMREALASLARSAPDARVVTGDARGTPRLAFVFSGQGAQRPGMGAELYARYPVFREALEACASGFDRGLAHPLRAVMWASPGSEAALLDQTEYTQASLFALEYALYQLWRSFGVEPDILLGHSVGEIAAACVAEVFSLPDALRLVGARGRLLQALPRGGAMISVETSEADAAAAVAPHAADVSVAAVNGPTQVVLSGVEAVVSALGAAFEARGVRTKRLQVSHAFHSPLMVPALDELRKVAETIVYHEPRRPIVSNVSGAPGGGELATPDYWVRHARETVRFADGVRALGDAGVRTVVELGPSATLLALVSAGLRDAKPTLLASLRRGRGESETMLEALARCYVVDPRIGSSLERMGWEGVFPHARTHGPRVSLPTYPFQRTRHWIDPARADHAEGRRGGHPLLGPPAALSTPGGARLYEIPIGLTRLPWLADHLVDGAAIFPGAGYVEMALAAGAEVFGEAAIEVRELVISQALPVATGAGIPVQLVASDLRSGLMRVQIASQPPGAPSWTVHARAEVRRLEGVDVPARLDLPALRTRLGAARHAATVYAELASLGLAYGPSFQGIVALWKGEREALGQVTLPATDTASFQFHPALLDACFQVAAGALPDAEAAPWVPVEIGSLRLHRRPGGALWCHVRAGAVAEGAATRVTCDLLVTDEAGAPVAEVRGLVAQRLAMSVRRRDGEPFLSLDWERAELPPRRISSGRWLVLGDARGLGDALREALEEAGHAVVHRDAEMAGAGALRALLTDAFGGEPPTGVVLLPRDEEPGEPGEADLLRGCERVLDAVQALSGMGYRDAPRLWLVTRGAQAAGSGAIALTDAPCVGLGRVIAMEHPELRCARLDLDPRRPRRELEAVLAELLADDPEDEIALREGERRVARLVRADPDAWMESANGRAFALGLDAPGVLDRLVLRATERRPPRPGEVEIAVEAVGLNFLDVLLALGVMPDELSGGEGLRLGSECAGRVLAVGEGVEGLAPGDAVLALARGAVASHVTTPSALVARRPSNLSVLEAASVPIAYLTAFYALERVARLRRGERVLIHAATGGVGVAALDWAEHVGAEVFATAGTPEKRAMLAQRGVRHVSDSRSDQFVADVRAWTGGEGVDVVLNSLSGDLLEKSFDLLRPYGRFVEIGKRDYYANGSLGMKPFLRNLSLSLVDLRAMILGRPDHVRELLAEVLGLFEQGVFKPPAVEGFSIARVGDAFRKMAQAKHTGKLAITFDAPDVAVRVQAREAPRLHADGTYLVTGGLGGLGSTVAGWLAENGAGHVVLVGRSGASTAAQEAAIAALQARGSRVTVAAVDVADRAALHVLLSSLPRDLPLRGVVHAAGVLDDGLLSSQTPARFRRVLAPKAMGALNLHALTRDQPLDFFVLYSSAASLLGSPGQGSYVAANSFLDALAHHRRACGLPAVSINWGAFSGIGMAANAGHEQRLAGRGMRGMTPAQGIVALAQVLKGSPPQIGVAAFDVRQWLDFYPLAACSPRLARLVGAEPDGRPGDPAVRELLEAVDAAERQRRLEGFLRREVSLVLRIPPEQIDAEAPLTSLGMDSLMGLELRNRIEAALGEKLPAAALWTYPTLSALSRHLSPPGPAALEAARPSPDAAPSKEALLVEEVAHMPTNDLLSFVDDFLQRSNEDRR